MTQNFDTRAVDTDRIDSGGSRAWRSALAALIVGAVLGAVVGLLVGLAQPRTVTARTALSVLPDTAVTASNQTSGVPDQDATSFIQAQLVVLNGDQLAASVQQQLRLAGRPDVSSSQVGQTYVVQTSATAPTGAQALSEATATGQAYAALRTQQLGASLDAQIQQVNAQLQSVQGSLATATANSPSTITPAQSALQTQYQQLLATSSALQVSRGQVNSVVTVLSPASLVTAGTLSGTTGAVVIGVVVGAVIGVLLLLVVRRFSPRVRSVGDLTSIGVPVLLPVLPTASRRHGRAGRWRSPAARLLAARLSGRGDRRPTVVVGVTAGVGTTHVATSLAAATVEHGPVLLVLASGGVNGPRVVHTHDAHVVGDPRVRDAADEIARRAVSSEIAGVWVLPCDDELLASAGSPASSRARALSDVVADAARAGWQVVVDAPALSESDLAVAVATGSATTVLVVARGASRPADVVSGVELFTTLDRDFAGVVLNAAPRRLRRRAPRTFEPASVRPPVSGSSAPPVFTEDAAPVARTDDFMPSNSAARHDASGFLPADVTRRGRRRVAPAGGPNRGSHTSTARRAAVASSNGSDTERR